MKKSKYLAALAAVSLTVPGASAAVAPYASDANTLHLWHMDDSSSPATAAVGGVDLVAGSGATLGDASFPGFGSAGNTSANDNSEFLSVDTYDVSTVTGANGAFTFEAIIKTAETSSIQEIFAMENNGGASSRPFQFRLFSGNVDLANIATAASDNVSVAIPTTGPHAFVANEWFHVAVTYDGNDGVAGSCKVYWTRLASGATEANEITAGTEFTNDLAGSASKYGVGNDGRTFGGADKNMEGLIDEIRISNIARAADEFIFGPADTDPPVLLSTDPVDGAANVATSSNLVASFDEAIKAVSGGTIYLTDLDTPSVTTIAATDLSQVSVSGGDLIIDPTGGLVTGTTYAVTFGSNTISDVATTANIFADTTFDTSTWNFTTDSTAPTLVGSTPADSATNVSPLVGSIVLNFSEDVQKGSGSLSILRVSDDSVVATTDVTSGIVTVSGSTVTVLLPQLPDGEALYVNIAGTAFTDLSGLPYAGISDKTTLDFTTAVIPTGLLFSEDFVFGTTENLSGSTPDVTTWAATWVASPNFNRDGSTDQGAGSATLAFTPFNGYVYTLDATLWDVTGNGNWFGLGFANGQSTGSDPNQDRFITGTVMGTAWTIYRGDASVNPNNAFIGLGTGGNGGLTDGQAWAVTGDDLALGSSNPGGDVDIRIVLDTRSGPGGWTATWYAKRPTDGAYVEMRATEPMLNESFNSVGLARSNAGVFGSIESFSLFAGTEFPDLGSSATAFETWADSNGLTGAVGFEDGQGDDPDAGGLNNLGEFGLGGDPLDGNDDGALLHAYSADVAGDSEEEGIVTILVRNGAVGTFSTGDPSVSSATDGIVYTVAADTIPAVGGGGLTVTPTAAVTTGLSAAPAGYTYASFYISGAEGYFQVTVAPAP